MTEQSQMPLVGPPKRRGWREIIWFRPLTSSTHATLVVTRRGRLASILPASSPRALSDYLAWPYEFREVDTRERLLVLDQRLESFDGSYEFRVSLRLVYQVAQPDRVALELDDAQAELVHAVVQSLRLSGRSFGIEQDKTFEEHLQATLITGDALVQRIRSLGLVPRRADVTVTLDEQTRAHAEALRFAMRERPLHFQVAVESLEPDHSFDVHVGGAYRLTERRAQDGPSEAPESAIQMAIARTLRRVGITFAPSDYPNAAKAMAETLRRDALLQSELSMVQAQLLRPTVQIQPDRSMVHVPRPNPLGVPDMRADPILRRVRQGLPRAGRPPALVDMSESEEPRQATPPAERRALPPPEQLPADVAASQTLPLGELPAPNDPIEGTYALWPLSESLPAMRALPAPGQPDDEQDAGAPWADLINSADAAPQDIPWLDSPPPVSLSAPVEPLPWESTAMAEANQPPLEQPASQRLDSAAPLSAPVEPLSWESATAASADQPPLEPPASQWLGSAPVEPLPGESMATNRADQPPLGAPPAAEDAVTLTWTDLDAGSEADTSFGMPVFSSSDVSGDLGFTLDWSDPEGAPAAEQPDSEPAPLTNTVVDELGFTLDWSEPQPDPYSSVRTPSADTITDDSIITAHWDDQAIALPEPPLFSDPPVEYVSASAATVDLELSTAFASDQAQLYSDEARAESQPAETQQIADQDEAQPVMEGEAPPWYAPTMHLDDYGPFDATADDATYTPPEILGAVWAEPPVSSEPASDVAANATAQPSPETLDVAGEEQPVSLGAPAYDTDADATAQPWLETLGAEWVEPPAMVSESVSHTAAEVVTEASLETPSAAWAGPPASSEPAYDTIADAVSDTSLETIGVAEEAESMSPSALAYDTDADATAQPLLETLGAVEVEALVPEQEPWEANERMSARAELSDDISAELIARMIGMIQSYGPAWFKMWSLELKERPERLPVVLGEVTADPVLLAQAHDPRVQAALLLALGAYSSPAAFPARLPAPAPLPSPAMASQSNDDDDAVPDWLSLRVKWNGHGGGA